MNKRPVDDKIHALRTKLIAAQVRDPSRSGRGRIPDIHICPGCGIEAQFTDMVTHFSGCHRTQLMLQEEWFASIGLYGKPGKQYKCPLGCRHKGNYRDLLHHIPYCDRQDEHRPYTLAQWRKSLIEHREQPGADLIDELERSQERATPHATASQ